MQLKKQTLKITVISSIILISILFVQCSRENIDDITDDAQKIAALRKVTVTYDSLGYTLGLPEGALGGQSFEELMEEDPDKYGNPENYSIELAGYLKADNTAQDAQDAKFDGLGLDIVMDTITQAPINATAGEFEIPKNTTATVVAAGSINLATHRLTGLYMFGQIAEGLDLSTTIIPILYYEIGIQEGTIPLPGIQKDIPTRASDETKAFLRGLIDSGVFDIPINK